LEFNHWRRYQPGYVYRPFSTTDFVLEYDINITDDGGNANLIGPGFSDNLGTKKTIQNGAFAVYYAGFGGPQIDIQTFVNGSVEWDCGGWGNLPNRIWINTNTTYYVRFEKSNDILKLSIFSDAERTQHISGSPKAVSTNLPAVTFNYFYTVNGPHADNPGANWEWTTGWIDNIYVKGQITPTNTQEIVEDFSVCNSDWLEYDPKNKIEIDCTNDHRLEFNHWIRYEPGYVYRPFSTTDFVLEYDINISNHGGNGNVVGPGFSDTLGATSTTQNGIFSVFYAGWPGGGGVPHLDLHIYENGTQILDWTQFLDLLISTGTTYYLRVEKSGSNVTFSIFSDAARTSHINGSPKTFTTNLTNTTFNYFYAVNGYHTSPQGNWEWTGGWIDNIYVRTEQAQNQPPVVDAGLDQIVEQENYEGTEVTQTGHVSDTDGDDLTYQWKEGDTVLASGTVPAPNEPPTDTDVTLTHIFPPGEHTVTLTVSDGEISSSDDVLIIVHDTVSPFSMLTTIPVAPDGLNGWFKSAVQVTITAEDNGSGVKEIYYKKDSDTVFTIVQGDHAVFYPGDGIYTIEYYAKDKAGNEESFHNTYNFNVDTAAPVTAAAVHGNGSGNTYINHAAILLKAADAMSGVKEIHYIINGSETVVPNANATINLNQVGTYTIQYRAIDNAGNQEEHHSLQLEIISPRAGVVVIKNIIASLTDTAFAKNAQNRRNALLNKLDQVIAAIDSGQYPDAVNKLVNDIGKKIDGCVTSGTADKNDWIVDCQAQTQLNTWINILVAELTEMMNG
jgi:hypothetical protein